MQEKINPISSRPLLDEKEVARYDLASDFQGRFESDISYRHAVVLELFESQTPDEQVSGETKYSNGAGFSAPDAPILSPIAERLIRGETLKLEDEEALRKRLPKYWSQFTTLLDLEEIRQGRKPSSTTGAGQRDEQKEAA